MASFVFDKKVRKTCIWLLVISILVMLIGQVGAFAAMTSGFTVKVSNVTFVNKNGLTVRGKLYQPSNATVPIPRLVWFTCTATRITARPPIHMASSSLGGASW